MYSKIFLEVETNQKPTWKLGRWHKALFLYIEIVEERKMMLSQQDDSTKLAWIVPFFCVLNGIVAWTVIIFLYWWCLFGVLNINALQKLASKSFIHVVPVDAKIWSCWCVGYLPNFSASISICLCRETISSFDLTTWVEVDD